MPFGVLMGEARGDRESPGRNGAVAEVQAPARRSAVPSAPGPRSALE